MPSKSIVRGVFSSSESSPTASGEGGGVFSYLTLDIEALFGGGDMDVASSCERFIFFDGVSVFSESVEGGESRAAAREACDTGS